MEVLAILKALRLFFGRYHGRLVVESDSFSAIAWVLTEERILGKLNFTLMKSWRYLLVSRFLSVMRLDLLTL